jgi:chromosome partitioning protein
MGKIYGLVQRKGGVGKTTSAGTLAVEFALRTKARTLAVEMDTQRNLSNGLGINLDSAREAAEKQARQEQKAISVVEAFPSIYEVLFQPEFGIGYATYRTQNFGIDILPAVAAMSGAEHDLSDAIARESRLKVALREAGTEKYVVEVQAADLYPATFIDSPPSLGLLTMNVLAASDYVLIPCDISSYALESVPEVLAAVELVKRINRTLKVGGIFCTKYDARNKLSENILQELRARFGALVFDTVIPLNTRIAEAPVVHLPIQVYDAQSSSALAYRQLAQEIEARCP